LNKPDAARGSTPPREYYNTERKFYDDLTRSFFVQHTLSSFGILGTMEIAIIIAGTALLVGTFLHRLIAHHPDDGPSEF
jgi:hypothetical protein